MQSWNIIFLFDQTPPTKIVLLKRASNKNFAPNMYTGIGGKVETNETLLESAYRELQEETGITNVHLEQVSKVIIDNEEELVYFWGKFDGSLPHSEDGILEWVSTDDVLTKNIIPTTLEMLKIWKVRHFSPLEFTLHVKTVSEENGIKQVQVIPSQ